MFASIRCLEPARLAPVFTWACVAALWVGSAFALPPATATPGAGASRWAELEREFWACDHAATTGALDFGMATHCSAVTEGLRKQRFAGDAAALRAWRREHKTAQHAALDAARRAAKAREPVVHAGPPSADATARPQALPHGAASARVSAQGLEGATPQSLQEAYLACDRLATTDLFDSHAAEVCSLVYETLKARVFGGSTERLIAWWRRQRQAHDAPH